MIGSGNIYSIKHFLNLAFDQLKLDKRKIISNKKNLIRKNEILSYKSNPSLIKRKLGWKNSLSLREIVKKMINEEYF